MMEKKGWPHRWRWEPAVGFGKELMACTGCPDAPVTETITVELGGVGHAMVPLVRGMLFFKTFIPFIGVLACSFSTSV